jgi:hypothetical protein
MNRAERRRLERQGLTLPKDPTLNIKLSELGKKQMTPTMQSAMMHEINQQCLDADARYSLDIDTMVLWSLHRYLGFGAKRLRQFYEEMVTEHKAMREYYQMDEMYPERYKLKEIGVDVEAWQKELFD